jgi:hypothetical protein
MEIDALTCRVTIRFGRDLRKLLILCPLRPSVQILLPFLGLTANCSSPGSVCSARCVGPWAAWINRWLDTNGLAIFPDAAWIAQLVRADRATAA